MYNLTPISAYQLSTDFKNFSEVMAETSEGQRPARPGDWRVQFDDNSTSIYDTATFETLYVW